MRRRLLKVFLLGITLLMIPLIAMADESGNCGDALDWTFSDQGVLTITGSGAMEDYNKNNRPPWQQYATTLNSIIIEEGVTTVGNDAFNLYAQNLTDIFLPSTLTTIGTNAFYEISNQYTFHYKGSEDDWNKVNKLSGNLSLTNNTILFTACANHIPRDPVHENEVAATCEYNGSYNEVIRCSVCNEIISSTPKTIEALGHDYGEWTQTTAPACTEAGEETRECIRCHVTETRPVAALGHDKEHHDPQAATCTAAGWNGYDTCKRAGCNFTTKVEIPALGHDFGAWVQTAAPKCLTAGEETRTCSRCDAFETQTVAALEHTPVHHEAVPAECLTDGNIEYWSCSRCSGLFSDSTCETPISVEETVIQQLGHNFGDWNQTIAPTCTAEGEKIRYCSRCDASQTEPVDALGHEMEYHEAKAATCTDAGWTAYETCSRCDYSTYQEIPSPGHLPGETIEEIIKDPTCTETGEAYDVTYCSVCGKEFIRTPKVIDALGHEEVIDEAVAATCTTTGLTEGKHCSRCNKTLTVQTVVERAAHTPGHPVRENENPSTCQASGSYDEVIYCTVCGNEISRKQIITAPAHTYGEPQYTWSDDNLVCTAVKICAVCHASDSQIRFVSDHVDFRVDQSPTGDNPGTAICHAVFSDDSITAFKEITIPALNNMTVLYLPSDLEIIEEEAFTGIASEAVIIPDRCREIGQNAFANCENLKYIRIPKSVTLIAENAFVGSNMVMIDQETAPEQEPE